MLVDGLQQRISRYIWLAWPALWLVDALLCVAIVVRVPYTEIDWKAYMEQIALIRGGETDYANIFGGTGPLVYPGGHVRIFNWLYELCDEGRNLRTAQYVFIGVYLATLAIVLNIYKRVGVPVFYAGFLILSKRLHSIYLLRMFNDCWVTLFAVAGIRLVLARRYALATLLLSAAVSVKMSALLYLPGVAIVMWNDLRWSAAALAIPFAIVQVAAALPFLDHLRSYLHGGFEFGRQFMHKWTVNWRFVDPELFNSPEFATALLSSHLMLLALLAKRTLGHKLTTKNAFRTIVVANGAGILSARSLHYQFYSWFYWTVPFMMADLGPASVPIWLLLEWSWNVFPSTNQSSMASLGALATLLAASQSRT